MCKVYIYEAMAGFTDGDLAEACGQLDSGRRAKALGYVHPGDRKQSAIAWLLLRHALRDAYSLEEVPATAIGRHGKPYLAGEGKPHFNLSHCGLAVACAVGACAVGVDVEPYASYSEDVAREVLGEEELREATGNPALFAELWTKKESYLKYTGEGLTDGLRTLLGRTGDVRFSTHHGGGYACTVCTCEPIDEPPTYVDKRILLHG